MLVGLSCRLLHPLLECDLPLQEEYLVKSQGLTPLLPSSN